MFLGVLVTPPEGPDCPSSIRAPFSDGRHLFTAGVGVAKHYRPLMELIMDSRVDYLLAMLTFTVLGWMGITLTISQLGLASSAAVWLNSLP